MTHAVQSSSIQATESTSSSDFQMESVPWDSVMPKTPEYTPISMQPTTIQPAESRLQEFAATMFNNGPNMPLG